MKPFNMSYRLPVVITKQNKRFVAYTPALDLSTSGKSAREVKKKFAEISRLFFEEIVEAGTTREVLAELGWTRVGKMWEPPKVISSAFLGIKVPVLA